MKEEIERINPFFEVQVKISYEENESEPEFERFLFSYRVRITNKSSQKSQLMSRYWIITNGYGEVEEVRGAGVVGVQPIIQAGATFEYESSCPLKTSSGSMKGFYQMKREDGVLFEIEIPEFYLINPCSLH